MRHKLIVRSKNHSCAPLRQLMVPKRTILRLGSTTPTEKITRRKDYIELNSPEGCAISGNKILMKDVFIKSGVHTAEYFLMKNNEDYKIKNYLNVWKTIIAKHKHSSKGNGIFLIENYNDFLEFKKNNNCSQFVFEKYYHYNREYRIHVTKDGCFYTCRKMLKRDAEVRWHRHDNNSVWILEDNPLFQKPDNWDDIVNDCVKALKALKLDIAAFDVKCEGNGKANPDWIILESNSAPALGEVGIKKYSEKIVSML